MVKELLQFFIGKVDTQLLETVELFRVEVFVFNISVKQNPELVKKG